MSESFAANKWVFMLGATLPNLAIGVLLLVFRRRILALIAQLAPGMSENVAAWISRGIVIAGLFLIAIPAILIGSAIRDAVGG